MVNALTTLMPLNVSTRMLNIEDIFSMARRFARLADLVNREIR